MMGELSALGSALCWAVSALLLRSQTERISAISLNALQYLFAALFFLVVFFLAGRVALLMEIAPVWMAALIGSALIGMAGGDTMYVRSLGLIGVARAFPFATSGYLLLTFVVAVAFLGESLTLKALMGGVAVVVGISLIALSTPQDQASRANPKQGWSLGLVMAAGAALCWSSAVYILKLALAEADVIAANAIRLPAVALVLLALSAGRGTFKPRRYGRHSIGIVGLAGVLGIGIGSMLFLFAIQVAGAAKTAALSSTSPLFAVPLSAIFLGERVTVPVIAGTLLCVVGVVLLT